MAHVHNVYDTDNHFVIDPISRNIRRESGKTVLMQHDHNSERYTFELPRYIEGHDMSTCNDIRIHYINISTNKSYQSEGPYPVCDMQIEPNFENTIIFSWLLSGNTTMYDGSLNFAISFACVDGDIIDYAWHTDVYSEITVLSGMHNDSQDIVVEYHDVLLEWENRLFGSGTSDSNPDDTVVITEITPDKVVFPDGANTTYAIGNVKLENGSGVLVEPGGTLADFFNVFIDEKTPETTDPSVSITFSQAKAHEVGTKITPSYSATFDPGSYTYGPDTGVTATAWEVTDTLGNKSTKSSGSFAQLQITDSMSYKITAKATHGEGTTPVTNTGKPYEVGKIAAGTKSKTSGSPSGYRNTFYGTLTSKTALTSSVVRNLAGKSGKTLSNGNSFTVDVPVGALRVVIAYPATLRNVTSIKDVNGMNADITSSFVSGTLNVEGANSYKAISYKIYILDFANANDTANKYTVTI